MRSEAVVGVAAVEAAALPVEEDVEGVAGLVAAADAGVRRPRRGATSTPRTCDG